MDRADLVELHYITPIANLPSILEHGLLSSVRAQTVAHASVAMEEIQDLRRSKTVPGGRRLHEYVNLYFNARNAMLFKRKHMVNRVCVLRVSPAVLDLLGVVVTDQNAASGYARFYTVVAGLRVLVKDYLFAESWIHAGDDIETMRHRSGMCAEVLVPDRVPPEYIMGCYVGAPEAEATIVDLVPGLRVTVSRHLFFRG